MDRLVFDWSFAGSKKDSLLMKIITILHHKLAY